MNIDGKVYISKNEMLDIIKEAMECANEAIQEGEDRWGESYAIRYAIRAGGYQGAIEIIKFKVQNF